MSTLLLIIFLSCVTVEENKSLEQLAQESADNFIIPRYHSMDANKDYREEE